VVRSHTRPYRPQTNGKAGRFIKLLINGWAYAEHWSIWSMQRDPGVAEASACRSNGDRLPQTRITETHRRTLRRAAANTPSSYSTTSKPITMSL